MQAPHQIDALHGEKVLRRDVRGFYRIRQFFDAVKKVRRDWGAKDKFRQDSFESKIKSHGIGQHSKKSAFFTVAKGFIADTTLQYADYERKHISALRVLPHDSPNMPIMIKKILNPCGI